MNLRTASIVTVSLLTAISSAAGLPWAKDYKSALQQAKKSHSVVMVDFTASWCVNCHKLDRTTYVDPSVVQALKRVVAVHVDYDKENALAKKYKAMALPVIVFIDGNQHELGRITGYLAAKEFLAQANPIISKGKNK